VYPGNNTCAHSITTYIEQPATCPVPGDVLTDGTCVTPPGGGGGGGGGTTTTTTTTTVDYCPNIAVGPDGKEWAGYDCPIAVAAVEAVTPEAPVVIAAPEPATIPTKKPAKVHVAQPANVDAGVATVPTATIPSAVNAGGGSSGNHGPNTGLLLLALTATGVCLIATGRLLATRSR